jgi:hypothetical protein
MEMLNAAASESRALSGYATNCGLNTVYRRQGGRLAGFTIYLQFFVRITLRL